MPSSSEAIWDGRPWKREWLLEALADLKSCRFARFTDNFVRFNATPGNIGWADNGSVSRPGRQGGPLRVVDETVWRQRAGD